MAARAKQGLADFAVGAAQIGGGLQLLAARIVRQQAAHAPADADTSPAGAHKRRCSSCWPKMLVSRASSAL
jgi:hypothetical protein